MSWQNTVGSRPIANISTSSERPIDSTAYLDENSLCEIIDILA